MVDRITGGGAVVALGRPREQGGDGASVVGAATTTGVVGASLALLPTTFDRPRAAHLGKLLPIGLVAGAGIGAASAGAANLVADDGIKGGARVAAAGGAAILAGTAVGNGGRIRDLGSILRSTGALVAGGGVAVAGSSALDRSLPDSNAANAATGLGLGVAGGALAVGALAIGGAMRRAPSAADAARHVLAPAAGSLDGVTPQVAADIVAARTDAAATLARSLPARTDDPWRDAGMGKAFLRGVATKDDIAEVMGGSADIRQPVRLFAGVAEAATPRERADLLLQRFDAMRGTSFGTIHVINPGAFGETNELVPLAVEHGRRGDVISIMAQTSATTPEKAMLKLDDAAKTFHHVLRGVRERVAHIPEGARPHVVMSALCYGNLPVHRVLERAGGDVRALGVDNALLVGAPAISRTARSIAGELERGERAGLLVRSSDDIAAARAAASTPPAVTMVIHDDDPLRIGAQSLLVPFAQRDGQPFVPIMSAASNWFDQGLDEPVAGMMREVGHRFEVEGSAAADLAFGLGMTREQLAGVDQQGVRFNAIRAIAKDAPPTA